jgi:hypothetical protein
MQRSDVKLLNLSRKDKKMLVGGLLTAVTFVVVGVLLFSYANETLDVQAELIGAEDETIYEAPFPDYVIVGFENEVGNIILGVAATAAVFGITLGFAMILRKSKGKR